MFRADAMKRGIGMPSKPSVGILVPKEILPRIVRRRPTWEAADLYCDAAKGLGIDLVLFTLGGYSPREKAVRGYIRQGDGWQRWKGPLPQAVHNRVVPATLGLFYLIRLMAKQVEAGVFNPAVTRDRWDVWSALFAERRAGEQLLFTRPLDRALCYELPRLLGERGPLMLRPGYLPTAPGAVFIEAASEHSGRFRVTSATGRSRLLSRSALVLYLRRRRARWPHIVQDRFDGVEYRGGPCILRLPVQRDGDGVWQVAGATLRAAGGRGPGAGDPVLRELFGAYRAAEIRAELARTSVDIVERLSRKFPGIADVALDFALDGAGRPWLIDVDFRDQRTEARLAGLVDLHGELYRRPMEYAAYLIRRSGR